MLPRHSWALAYFQHCFLHTAHFHPSFVAFKFLDENGNVVSVGGYLDNQLEPCGKEIINNHLLTESLRISQGEQLTENLKLSFE